MLKTVGSESQKEHGMASTSKLPRSKTHDRDFKEKRPLRLIIPLVFYHGAARWNVASSFAGQFEAPECFERFLPDFEYLLFDTDEWGVTDLAHEQIRNNLKVFSAIALMRNAFGKDFDELRQVFRLWAQHWLDDNTDELRVFIEYLVQVKDTDERELIRILEEEGIEGGTIMPSLAQRWFEDGKNSGKAQWIRQGIEQGIEEGIEQGIEEGIEQGKLAVARNLLAEGTDPQLISKATGLPLATIQALANEPEQSDTAH